MEKIYKYHIDETKGWVRAENKDDAVKFIIQESIEYDIYDCN